MKTQKTPKKTPNTWCPAILALLFFRNFQHELRHNNHYMPKIRVTSKFHFYNCRLKIRFCPNLTHEFHTFKGKVSQALIQKQNTTLEINRKPSMYIPRLWSPMVADGCMSGMGSQKRWPRDYCSLPEMRIKPTRNLRKWCLHCNSGVYRSIRNSMGSKWYKP